MRSRISCWLSPFIVFASSRLRVQEGLDAASTGNEWIPYVAPFDRRGAAGMAAVNVVNFTGIRCNFGSFVNFTRAPAQRMATINFINFVNFARLRRHEWQPPGSLIYTARMAIFNFINFI